MKYLWSTEEEEWDIYKVEEVEEWNIYKVQNNINNEIYISSTEEENWELRYIKYWKRRMKYLYSTE